MIRDVKSGKRRLRTRIVYIFFVCLLIRALNPLLERIVARVAYESWAASRLETFWQRFSRCEIHARSTLIWDDNQTIVRILTCAVLRSICKDWMVKPSRMKCSIFVGGRIAPAIFRLSTLLLASIRLRINSSMNVRFRRIRLTRNN